MGIDKTTERDFALNNPLQKILAVSNTTNFFPDWWKLLVQPIG